MRERECGGVAVAGCRTGQSQARRGASISKPGQRAGELLQASDRSTLRQGYRIGNKEQREGDGMGQQKGLKEFWQMEIVLEGWFMEFVGEIKMLQRNSVV